jgi:hypothetical protein
MVFIHIGGDVDAGCQPVPALICTEGIQSGSFGDMFMPGIFMPGIFMPGMSCSAGSGGGFGAGVFVWAVCCCCCPAAVNTKLGIKTEIKAQKINARMQSSYMIELRIFNS